MSDGRQSLDADPRRNTTGRGDGFPHCCYNDGMIYRVLRPILFQADPESAHYFAMNAYRGLLRMPGMKRLVRWRHHVVDDRLRVDAFGLSFPRPLGLAAGFDKNAEWFNELGDLGFGSVEVGTLTAQPQPGNDRPRLFRVPQDRALINRFGFNNRGADVAAHRLSLQTRRVILGINIGKSKVVANERAVHDYLASFSVLWPHADYLVVNVSSPNTPGLRALQDRGPLLELLTALQERNDALAHCNKREPKPLLVKIAPDLTLDQMDDVVQLSDETRLAGLIATNTTISRDGLTAPPSMIEKAGAGGLSGAPLTRRSRTFVAELFRRLKGRRPIIGVGGIMSGEDAWQMLRAGATLLQSYTGFVYGGPSFPRDVHHYLVQRLDERQATLASIVGEAADEFAKA